MGTASLPSTKTPSTLDASGFGGLALPKADDGTRTHDLLHGKQTL
jgi:hypothetical protein